MTTTSRRLQQHLLIDRLNPQPIAALHEGQELAKSGRLVHILYGPLGDH